MDELHEISAGGLNVVVTTNTTRLEAKYGPRFDRSAQVIRVEGMGRQWLSSPGMPDEFGLWGHGVLGYDEAEAGTGEFLKLGVGVLRKLWDEPYTLGRRWPVVNGVTAFVHSTAAEIGVEQRMAWKGWDYLFTKLYAVTETDGLTIRYALENLGQKPLPFEHYNHNFMGLASAGAAGRLLVIRPSFAVPEPPNHSKWHRTPGGIELSAESTSQRAPAWSWEPVVDGTHFRVILTWPDQTSVTVTADFPLARFALWNQEEHVCPELFYRSTLDPGSSVNWHVNYQFTIV